MPTSGTTELELTFADAAKSAAVELGAIGSADELADSEREEMQRRANSMLKTWSVEANLFREETTTATILGGTGYVDLDADVRDVGAVGYVQSATMTRQLTLWNRGQYLALPNRATVGFPVAFYLERFPDAPPRLRVYPVPATDITVEIDVSRGAYAITAPEETLDIPTEWHEAFIMSLASR